MEIKKKKNLINVYGPSECTCICSHHFVSKNDIFNDKEKFVSLGKISENFKFKIANYSKKRLGELVLYGKGVGNGYFKNQKETKSRFIIKNRKIVGYKTGDIIKIKNKKLYFIGRKDNQVKIMGYRIELEEIEKQINNIKNINEALVTLNKNSELNNYLIAHLYLKKKISDKKIFKILNNKLPKYMIPNKLIFYKQPLKKNRNYKIDRNFYSKII